MTDDRLTDQAPQTESRLQIAQEVILRYFIVIFVVLVAIDGLPSAGEYHAAVKRRIDVILDKTGLWQGSWRLFAPNVDKINSTIIARVELVDSRKLYWEAPQWKGLSRLDRFLRFRESEFFDSIRQNDNRAVWKSFGRFVISEAERQYQTPVKRIVVEEHWVGLVNPRVFGVLRYGIYPPFTNTRPLFKWSRK